MGTFEKIIRPPYTGKNDHNTNYSFDVQDVNKQFTSYFQELNIRSVHQCFYFLDNLALSGLASQSSTGSQGLASYAVDGIRDGNYFQYSCTHTQREDNPFWYVSFEPDSVKVSKVRISNRLDCCSYRLSNFEIRIGDYFGKEADRSPKCGGLHTVKGASKVISCPNMVGRFLTITIPGSNKILTLCEVEIFGTSKCCFFIVFFFPKRINFR